MAHYTDEETHFIDQLTVENTLRMNGFSGETQFSYVSGITYLNDDSSFHQVVLPVSGVTGEGSFYLPPYNDLRVGRGYSVWNESANRVKVYDSASGFLVNMNRSSRSWFQVKDVSGATPSDNWMWFITSKSSLQGTSPTLFNYGGAANVGRYMEFYPGEDSLNTPFFVPVLSQLIAITVQASASTTASLGVFVLPDTTTPVHTISLNAETFTLDIDLNVNLPPQSFIAIKVTSGSINKPRGSIYLQSL